MSETKRAAIAQHMHELGAASEQSGRVLDAIASVGLLDPDRVYSVGTKQPGD